jgi:hypothetical protein
MLYVVVYGQSYEYAAYFTDFEKALNKFNVHFKRALENKEQFLPFMEEYVESDGVYERTKSDYTPTTK